jgi:hypothetical protein
MLASFVGVLPILTPLLCALAFIMCSKSNPIVAQIYLTAYDHVKFILHGPDYNKYSSLYRVYFLNIFPYLLLLLLLLFF